MKVLRTCSILFAFFLMLELKLSACSYHNLLPSDDGDDDGVDEAAMMSGMSSLFHSLFPIVPGQAHFFWRTNQLGAATVHTKAAEPVREVSREWPWRVQIDFRKRGPDCMGKCITQGRLHPVQCHSLC